MKRIETFLIVGVLVAAVLTFIAVVITVKPPEVLHAEAFVESATPTVATATNTVTPQPTKTPLFDALPESIYGSKPPLDKVPFVKVVYKVTQTPAPQTVFTIVTATPVSKAAKQNGGTRDIQVSVEKSQCGTFTENGVTKPFTVDEAIRIFKEEFAKEGIPNEYGLPLILSESGFHNFVNGADGSCNILQNYQGAPAYCMGQIYEPGGATHPEVDASSLMDPRYCAQQSARIYKGFYRGDWILAAANYKGFGSSQDPNFVSNYMPAYNAGGVTSEDSGVYYNFKDP